MIPIPMLVKGVGAIAMTIFAVRILKSEETVQTVETTVNESLIPESNAETIAQSIAENSTNQTVDDLAEMRRKVMSDLGKRSGRARRLRKIT